MRSCVLYADDTGQKAVGALRAHLPVPRRCTRNTEPSAGVTTEGTTKRSVGQSPFAAHQGSAADHRHSSWCPLVCSTSARMLKVGSREHISPRAAPAPNDRSRFGQQMQRSSVRAHGEGRLSWSRAVAAASAANDCSPPEVQGRSHILPVVALLHDLRTRDQG